MAGEVDGAVVAGAEDGGVLEVGLAAVGPGVLVVGVAERGGDGAFSTLQVAVPGRRAPASCVARRARPPARPGSPSPGQGNARHRDARRRCCRPEIPNAGVDAGGGQRAAGPSSPRGRHRGPGRHGSDQRRFTDGRRRGSRCRRGAIGVPGGRAGGPPPGPGRAGARPRVLVGTSAGAPASRQRARWDGRSGAGGKTASLERMLGQTIKPNVMRPLWRQVPDVLVRYTSETLGCRTSGCEGCSASQPLARTLSRLIDWGYRNIEDGDRLGRRHGIVQSGSRHRVHRVGRRGTECSVRSTTAASSPPGWTSSSLMASSAIPSSSPPCTSRSRPTPPAGTSTAPPVDVHHSHRHSTGGSHGRDRHRRDAAAGARPRAGPARRRPGRRRRHASRCGRRWTTRCCTTCGGSWTPTR